MLQALRQGLLGRRAQRRAARPCRPRGEQDVAAINAWLQQGYELEQAGQLSAAERRYQRILEVDANNVDANYLLGRLKGRHGAARSALGYLRKAVATKPDFAEAHADLGNAYRLCGESAAAEQAYRRACSIGGGTAEAHLNLGCLLADSGRVEAGLRSLHRSAELNPDNPQAYCELGRLLFSVGRTKEAENAYRHALQIDSAQPIAWNGLGACLQRCGSLEAAKASYQAALREKGDLAQAHLNMANLLLTEGDSESAIDHYREAVAAQPDLFEAWFNLGTALKHKGDSEAARQAYQHALELRHDHAEVHFSLGLLAEAAQDWEEALDCFELATHFRPDYAVAYFRMATVSHHNGDNVAAERYYQQCCEHDPENAIYHNDRGVVQYELGKVEEALVSYRCAAQRDPALLPAWNNMSLALRDLGRIDEAHRCLQRILDEDPEFADAWCNLGLVLEDLGRGQEALQWYERALQRHPDDVKARWNRVLSWLLAGNYEQGWPGYELRWDLNKLEPRPFSFTRWEGGRLGGRTLLVYAEQGLGDEIMMASCVADLAALGGPIVIECDPRLGKLLQRSFPWTRVYGRRRDAGTQWLSEVGTIDVQIPIASLPLYLRRGAGSFPLHRGYLQADPQRVAYWRDRLRRLGPGLKVGLSWRGGTKRTRRVLRSIELERLQSLLALAGVQFVSLQYGKVEEEIRHVNALGGGQLHELPEAMVDYDETAALVCALDLVVSVQTAVIHLAGALGRPAWVMVPFSPEWRYRRDVATMPWYPSVRLFRQHRPLRWDEVIEAVRSELLALCPRA